MFSSPPKRTEPRSWSGECRAAAETRSNPWLSTPLPAALPLFATGLGALGLLGWRRKRRRRRSLHDRVAFPGSRSWRHYGEAKSATSTAMKLDHSLFP
jgi:hypothetical protein